MYLRFTLSFRDVEELLAERGIVVTYESIRRWVLTFGPAIAHRLRARRSRPHGRWHLDEMTVSIQGGACTGIGIDPLQVECEGRHKHLRGWRPVAQRGMRGARGCRASSSSR
jgi:hypothetical protein